MCIIKHYMVIWECHIDAESPRLAAEEAQEALQDSTCNWVFGVIDNDGHVTDVDLATKED